MKIISVNVGMPQDREWMGKTIRTSIFKSPVDSHRWVSLLNIEGDEQSDLRVHGGPSKAVYSYDISYYHIWKGVIQLDEWPHGLFGENLTTSGLLDNDVKIGSVYRAGTAELQVIQPRFPCVKLNLRFGRVDMMELFMQQGKHGIYFKVLKEGNVRAGDEIRLVQPSPYTVTISDYANCYYSKGADRHILTELMNIPFLPERHRTVFESYL